MVSSSSRQNITDMKSHHLEPVKQPLNDELFCTRSYKSIASTPASFPARAPEDRTHSAMAGAAQPQCPSDHVPEALTHGD